MMADGGDVRGGWREHPRRWVGGQPGRPLHPRSVGAAQSRQERPEEAQVPSSGAAKGGRFSPCCRAATTASADTGPSPCRC